MELTCPNCNSDNTQRLSAVFENGISTVNNKTHGVGLGLGRGGLAIGAAGASTSGTSQTVLSQRAAPPDRKPYLVPLLKIFGGFVVASVAVSALGVPILGALVTLAWIAATVGFTGQRTSTQIPGRYKLSSGSAAFCATAATTSLCLTHPQNHFETRCNLYVYKTPSISIAQHHRIVQHVRSLYQPDGTGSRQQTHEP